jgi:hypothetical protein
MRNYISNRRSNMTKRFDNASQKLVSRGKAVEANGNRAVTSKYAEDVQRAYAHVVELERRASEWVVMLDQPAMILDVEQGSTEERLAMLEGERELLLIDTEINERLKNLYTAATEGDRQDPSAMPVRIALLHWTTLLRRRSMQGFHTLVEGLEDDVDCRGDIIADQLLLVYFNTLFEDQRRTGREALAVRALTDLARQSACLGAQQSAQLASDLYWSFVELRGFLRLNGIEYVVPYVAQAAAAPMLLFYDVEKYRGPQSPLARWFAENYEWLIQGTTSKRIPLVWHGLWLYDRRSGRLIGYRPTRKPINENDVHLAQFFGSIVSRENLGRYDSSFAEMIERGGTAQGYLSIGSICAESKESGAGKKGSSWSKFGGKLQSSRSVTGQLSRAGLSEDTIKGTLCDESPSSGNNPDGSSLCGGGGLSGPGRNWAADAVRCLSQQVMQPGEKLMRCTAEALGLCSSPVDKAVKNLQQTSFAGIRLGDNCQLTEGGGSEGGGSIAKPKTEAQKKAEQKQKEAEAKLQRELAEAKKAAEAAEKARKTEEEKQAKAREASRAYAQQPTKENAAAREEANEEYSNATLDRIMAEAEYRYEEEQVYQAGQKLLEAIDDLRRWPNPNKRCPIDTPDCGGNACTGMSAAVMAVQSCFEDAAREEEREIFEREPGVVDPNPDEGTYPGFGNCFESYDDQVSAVHKECWAVDCGPESMTVMTAGGNCGCGPEITGDPSDHLTGMCATILCSDGSPTVRNGKCTCEGGAEIGGGTFGGGTILKGPFITSSPRLFTEVHIQNYLPPEDPRTNPYADSYGKPQGNMGYPFP